MIRRLTVEGGIRGVNFLTLNLEKSVQRILEALEWVGGTPHPQNRLISVSQPCRACIYRLVNVFTGTRGIPYRTSATGRC